MNIVDTLEHLVRNVPSHLQRVTEEEAARKANQNSWSKKEILGHLCDSAANNHMRFVKSLLASAPIQAEGYQQNQWVFLHGYQSNYTYQEMIMLWTFLNRQILYVLTNSNEEEMAKPVILSDKTTVTLGWLVEDYVNHMLHHMKQLSDASII